MNNIPVPKNWTVQQAVTVLDFLETLYGAIRDTYEQPLRELVNEEFQRQNNEDDEFDDDIPL